jgi:nucleoside-diphosphate-sugar epimerase
VVHASSSTVIGKAVTEVVDESHSERPLDIYSADKGVAENYYRIYHRAHGLKTVALRFANLYGPYGKERPEFGFVNYFIHLAHSGGQICVYGDGAQTRNLLYAEDAAAAMWAAAQAPDLLGEAWFSGHDEHFSVAEIAGRIVRATGRGSVAHVAWPEERLRMDVGSVRISSRRFRERAGWAPRYSFEKGLAKTLAHLDENVPA